MIIADTSVWIDHFRHSNLHLTHLLENRAVMTHPFVIGEIACGHLKRRKESVALLAELPMAIKAEDAEILSFIENHTLVGLGIGLIDIHLLASTVLSNVKIWSLDRKLHNAAKKLKISYL